MWAYKFPKVELSLSNSLRCHPSHYVSFAKLKSADSASQPDKPDLKLDQYKFSLTEK